MSQFQDVQLSLGEALRRELSRDLFSPHGCREWLFRTIHPERYACPHCGRELARELDLRRFQAYQWVRCSEQACGRRFDWRTGTILAGTSIDPVNIVRLALLLEIDAPLVDIARLLRVDKNTVRDWRDRLSILGSSASVSPTPIGEGTAAARGEGEV